MYGPLPSQIQVYSLVQELRPSKTAAYRKKNFFMVAAKAINGN
jgi:hypothetical protein